VVLEWRTLLFEIAGNKHRGASMRNIPTVSKMNNNSFINFASLVGHTYPVLKIHVPVLLAKQFTTAVIIFMCHGCYNVVVSVKGLVCSQPPVRW